MHGCCPEIKISMKRYTGKIPFTLKKCAQRKTIQCSNNLNIFAAQALSFTLSILFSLTHVIPVRKFLVECKVEHASDK